MWQFFDCRCKPAWVSERQSWHLEKQKWKPNDVETRCWTRKTFSLIQPGSSQSLQLATWLVIWKVFETFTSLFDTVGWNLLMAGASMKCVSYRGLENSMLCPGFFWYAFKMNASYGWTTLSQLNEIEQQRGREPCGLITRHQAGFAAGWEGIKRALMKLASGGHFLFQPERRNNGKN